MTAPTNVSISLDDLDLRILDQLQQDCSLTNEELANRVHASAPTSLRRVRRLTEAGIIQRQVALLDASQVGRGLTAIIEITLDRQDAEHMQAFEQHITQDAAIQQCYQVSPGPDFILIAQVQDMPAYHALAHRAFTSQTNVRNVRAFFSINCAKFETQIPLPAARDKS